MTLIHFQSNTPKTIPIIPIVNNQWLNDELERVLIDCSRNIKTTLALRLESINLTRHLNEVSVTSIIEAIKELIRIIRVF